MINRTLATNTLLLKKQIITTANIHIFVISRYLASEEDRKKHGTDVVCCVDFILGFPNGGNSFETVYCGYDL